MGIYTVEKQKLKKNENSSMGVRKSTERPKIKRFRRKGYRKNMSCCLQVKYSVFFL